MIVKILLGFTFSTNDDTNIPWEGNATRNKSRMNIAVARGISVSQTHLVGEGSMSKTSLGCE